MPVIVCHTNLDLCQCEVWPTELSEVPRVGDYIESAHRWQREQYDLHLELVVCAVRWKTRKGVVPTASQRMPHIEMTVPSRYKTMREFYEWYGRVCGRGVHAFI